MPYEKHTWLRGETITAENLNHLEDGIVGEQTTRASQDQLINERIDQVIAPTGEAPNPSEITDARIGEDGTVYNTLGTAIRTQVGDLKNALSSYVGTSDTNSYNIEYNVYRLTTSRFKSYEISKPVQSDSTIEITATGGYKFCCAYADTDQNFTTWKTEYSLIYSSLNGRGLKLWIQKSDTSEITDAEIPTMISSVIVQASVTPVFGNLKTCYVDVSGNDENDGTLDHPFATITNAIKKGYRNILVNGGIYNQNIELPNSGVVKLSPSTSTGKVTFVNPNALKITSATVYSGNVYVADTDFSQLSVTPMIFQDGIADANTLISNNERMPQQRGRQYRCNDTRIYKCSSDNLIDALTEMEEGYKFYFDENKLYFTSPSSDFANHPIMCGDADTELFTNLSRGIQLEVSGIDCKYMRFSVANTVNSVISNCSCSGAYANSLGQFMTDNAINARFVKCEASLSHGASGGDGFNGHSTNSGDADAHESGTILIDCWSHDNTDDGYSEHYRGESFILGGLYEYNVKGGVTPSYGTHCYCEGVLSRKNLNGFLCLNAGSDNGLGTQMECVNCMAINNTSDQTNHGFGFKAYSNSGANGIASMICKSCYSEGNSRYGYCIGTYADSTAYGLLIDCTALNNTIGMVDNRGTCDIKNGTPVTL